MTDDDDVDVLGGTCCALSKPESSSSHVRFRNTRPALLPSSMAASSSSSTADALFTLITAAELSSALSSGSHAPLLLLEACVPAQPQQDRRSIPGAVRFCISSIDVYEDDAHGHPRKISGNHSLRPAKELRAALEAAGVTHLTRTVVFTQSTKAGGPDLAVAARLCWALARCGVQHVSLLAGGVHSWMHDGFELASAPSAPVHRGFYDGAAAERPFPLRPEYDASTAEVEAAVASQSGVQLADVRSWREFIGSGHDYPFPLPCGRIPGARWAHWGPSTYVGGDFFRHETGALHPITQTAELWADWGLQLGGERRIVFYCGSGWRSAVAWCLARLLGHINCASYDGGFLEWSMLDERAAEHPIAHGVPTEQQERGVAASAAAASPAAVGTRASLKRMVR